MFDRVSVEIAKEQYKDRLREAQQARLIRRVKSNTHQLSNPLRLKRILLMSGLR